MPLKSTNRSTLFTQKKSDSKTHAQVVISKFHIFSFLLVCQMHRKHQSKNKIEYKYEYHLNMSFSHYLIIMSSFPMLLKNIHYLVVLEALRHLN